MSGTIKKISLKNISIHPVIVDALEKMEIPINGISSYRHVERFPLDVNKVWEYYNKILEEGYDEMPIIKVDELIYHDTDDSDEESFTIIEKRKYDIVNGFHRIAALYAYSLLEGLKLSEIKVLVRISDVYKFY